MLALIVAVCVYGKDVPETPGAPATTPTEQVAASTPPEQVVDTKLYQQMLDRMEAVDGITATVVGPPVALVQPVTAATRAFTGRTWAAAGGQPSSGPIDPTVLTGMQVAAAATSPVMLVPTIAMEAVKSAPFKGISREELLEAGGEAARKYLKVMQDSNLQYLPGSEIPLMALGAGYNIGARMSSIVNSMSKKQTPDAGTIMSHIAFFFNPISAMVSALPIPPTPKEPAPPTPKEPTLPEESEKNDKMHI